MGEMSNVSSKGGKIQPTHPTTALLNQHELERIRTTVRKASEELKKMKIGVVCGGDTKEREVSLVSGKAVYEALKDDGFCASLYDLDYAKLDKAELTKYDLLFLTLHGGRGENGTFQGYLDSLGVPYVSTGVLPSAIAMSKPVFKMIVTALGFNTPPYIHLIGRGSRLTEDQLKEIESEQFVIKPACEGSSVGVSIVSKRKLQEATKKTLKEYGEVIIEKYIQGKEVTVPILGERNKPVVLPLVEIAPKKEPFYTYKAKYTAGETEYIIPAGIPKKTAESIAKSASFIYQVVDFSPYVRIDTRVDAEGQVFFLEANNLPGFTPLSLFPQSARAVGISYAELLEILIYLSVKKKR